MMGFAFGYCVLVEGRKVFWRGVVVIFCFLGLLVDIFFGSWLGKIEFEYLFYWVLGYSWFYYMLLRFGFDSVILLVSFWDVFFVWLLEWV